MKCPKCGFVSAAAAKQCGKCGMFLFAGGEDKPGPKADAADWRTEVTQKVKAYGERKKILTTPPRPLKESPTSKPPALEPPAPPIDPGFIADPLSQRAPSKSSPPEPPAPLAAPLPLPDLHAEDLYEAVQELESQEASAAESPQPRYLWRRLASFAIDNIIIVVLQVGLMYACSWIIGYDLNHLLQDAWIPLAAVFLLFHCVYYSYSYKTSRQTPGQVFCRLELRDPLSGSIPLKKILIRWLAMVVLNMFNVVPALAGKQPLLLDRLSGTEIRLLKHE